jgi:hypothetical protein
VLKNEYLCTLGSYHRDGVNKDKIILVSQAANIVSKYTAFVGVDKDTKVPVSTICKPYCIANVILFLPFFYCQHHYIINVNVLLTSHKCSQLFHSVM